MLDMIVEIHPGSKRRRTAHNCIQRAVGVNPLWAKNLPQRPLHSRDLTAAADHQHRLNAVLIITALACCIECRPHRPVDFCQTAALVQNFFKLSAGKRCR